MVQINTRQFADQLPDLPPIGLEQDNITLNPPTHPMICQQKRILTNFKEKNQICPLSQRSLSNLICLLINLINLTSQINFQIRFRILPGAMVQPQQLNWSYFKPEFSGKPEEDAEEHLLRTNDWMEMHNFPDDQKVRRFCLTLVRGLGYGMKH